MQFLKELREMMKHIEIVCDRCGKIIDENNTISVWSGLIKAPPNDPYDVDIELCMGCADIVLEEALRIQKMLDAPATTVNV
jgi:hypothetical protein